MFRLLIAVTCLAGLTQAAPNGRIVGGEPTVIEKIPYVASLQGDGRHTCGAIIIGAYYLLTAAHCTQLYEASELVVRVGSSFKSSGGVLVQVAAIYQHPQYNFPFPLDNDASILQLASPLSFGSAIAPVPLPEPHQPIPAGSISQTSGWGALALLGGSPEQLHVVDLPVLSLEECRSTAYGDSITERMVCAGIPEGGKSGCHGDSGGPLVVNGTLIGIVSFGNGCAIPNSPGVYTRVSEIRDFITEITGL